MKVISDSVFHYVSYSDTELRKGTEKNTTTMKKKRSNILMSQKSIMLLDIIPLYGTLENLKHLLGFQYNAGRVTSGRLHDTVYRMFRVRFHTDFDIEYIDEIDISNNTNHTSMSVLAPYLHIDR